MEANDSIQDLLQMLKISQKVELFFELAWSIEFFDIQYLDWCMGGLDENWILKSRIAYMFN